MLTLPITPAIMCLDLYALRFGPYPRRVLIYIAEKGLVNSNMINVGYVDPPNFDAPGKPPGTTPSLRLPDGSLIGQSVSILECFEDICDAPSSDWEKQLASFSKQKTMRGLTAFDRTQTRCAMSLIEEAQVYFSNACHKGTALYAAQGKTPNEEAASYSMEMCRKAPSLVDGYYKHKKQLVGMADAPSTLADCMLFALLQFARNFYGVGLLTKDMENLNMFFERFGKRDSVAVPDDLYPPELVELGNKWIIKV